MVAAKPSLSTTDFNHKVAALYNIIVTLYVSINIHDWSKVLEYPNFIFFSLEIMHVNVSLYSKMKTSNK